MKSFNLFVLVLALLVHCRLSGQPPLVGAYIFPDSTYAAFGLWDDKPFVTFSNGDIRGIRKSSTGKGYEIGNSLGLFDRLEGTVKIKNSKISLRRENEQHKEGDLIQFSFKEYKFRNGDVSLSGTLIQPSGQGPFPCVILTHGSGPEKKEASFGLAFIFVSNGVAAFIYDKRFVHDKNEKKFEDSFKNYAEDAIAAAEILQLNPEVRKEAIGIYGHSQGGWVAPLAVSKSNLFSFLIISAGNAVSPVEQHLYNGECLGRYNGVKEWAIKEIKEFRYLKYEAGITGNRQKFDSAVVVARTRPWFWRTGEELPTGKFWQLNGYYDPQPALFKIQVPVLVLAGELDRYSDTNRNMNLFKQIFDESGNKSVTYKIFPSANHAFIKTSTGKPDEYEEDEFMQFADGYFELLGNWVKNNSNMKH